MDLELFNKIEDYRCNGASIYFKRSHIGVPKIKIKHGPFGFFTKRFETDLETFDKIKKLCNVNATKNTQ